MKNLKQKLIKIGFYENQIKSLANYQPYVISNNLIFISGQLPIENNKLKYTGIIGKDLSIEDSKKAVFLSTVKLLNVLCNAIDNESLSESNIKTLNIKGYINSGNNFFDHSILFNEASDLIIKIFGKSSGLHTRSVIGVSSLPLNSPVEIDGIFSISKQ